MLAMPGLGILREAFYQYIAQGIPTDNAVKNFLSLISCLTYDKSRHDSCGCLCGSAATFKILKGQIFSKGWGKTQDYSYCKRISGPGEGKNFVAANLASSIAQCLDEYALLVDCDVRRPRVHSVLCCPNKEGLQEYLTGKKALKSYERNYKNYNKKG